MVWPPETMRAILGCGPALSPRKGESRWPSMWLTAMNGLPLASAFEINETKSGRKTSVLHSFYQMDDGSFLAFFEAPGQAFE